MLLSYFLTLSVALAPSAVSAALFPENSQVKDIDAKGFRKAMKENMTSIVAFTAPWCGHCQKMAPEFSKAALGLYPIVPLYNVDCDAQKNKALCAEQGVQGFPTVKLYPRGKLMKPVLFEGPQRSASEFFYFGKRGIPNKSIKIRYIEDFFGDVNNEKYAKKSRVILMNKTNKKPLLWSALANKYDDDMVFFTHRDRHGKSSAALGFEKGGDEPKVLIMPPDATKPFQYKGILKFDSLSKFFDSLMDGTADLDELNEAAAQEEFIPDPEELKIEQQQEAEMLKLAHGGFSNMIDFEKAVHDGSAKNFHQQNGYPGMMGGAPQNAKADEAKTKVMKDSNRKDTKMPITEDAGQVVMEQPSSSATTSEAEATETPVTEADPEPEVEVEAAPALNDASNDEFEDVPNSVTISASETAEASGATATHSKDEL